MPAVNGHANGAGPSDLAHDLSAPSVLPSMSRHPSLQDAIAAIDVDSRSDKVIKIGTRASNLALVQANYVRLALESLQNDDQLAFRVAPMSTAGDRNKTEPLYLMGAKALWTKDLEVALLDNAVDCIVHSLKDMPTSLPDGCEIAAIMEREDPRDALIVKRGKPWKSMDEMPAGATVGSSSVRRVAQMRRKFPHLNFRDLRGNMYGSNVGLILIADGASSLSDTRLRKLDAEDGPYDAIILAAAGLIRTNQQDRITMHLQSPTMLHAVGQGALGIEVRSNDTRMKEMIAKLNHLETDWMASCERMLLRVLEGGCSVPVGVETQFLPPAKGKETGDAQYLATRPLALRAIIASLDGKRAIEHEVSRQIYNRQEAEALGAEVAKVLIDRGGRAILEELGRIVEQKNVKGINDQVARQQKEEHFPVETQQQQQ